MANPIIINPTMTLAGQAAAINASNTGLELVIDSVSFGRGHYDPTGTEVALANPVGSRVVLAGGSRPTPFQLRMSAAWKENVGVVPIGEIGFWAGNVLVFVWSKANAEIASYKTDGVTYVLFCDLAFSQVPANSVSIVVDPGESAALAALSEHEGSKNAHPGYMHRADVAKDFGPLAWLGTAGGTANALVLSLVADESELTSYAPGQRFQFLAKLTNTTAVTANIEGIGAVAVKQGNGVGLEDLSPGAIKAKVVHELVYDGTFFQLAGTAGGAGGSGSPLLSVLVATTANIVLSGSKVIDGETPPEGSRVLVKNQDQAKDNGIWVVSTSGAWKRALDADASVEVTPGLFVTVEKGTTNGDSVWQLVTDAPIVLGTTALTFEVVAGRTGVTAGTYRSLTVDKLGRVIAGTNPTTLAGAGITDAYTKPETVNAIQQAITSLVDSSPAALDTLKELAAALGNDPNFATTMVNALAGKADKSQLGTAAALAATASTTDSTLGRVLRVGDFGIGAPNAPGAPNTDADAIEATGVYGISSATTNVPIGAGSGSMLFHMNFSVPAGNQTATQEIVTRSVPARKFIRSRVAGAWGAWIELATSGVNSNITALNGLTARPSFAGNLAWDAGNFDPATKMPVSGGSYTPSFSSLRITANTAPIGAPGSHISYGTDGALTNCFNSVCNQGTGTGGFTWRTVNASNSVTGPTMSYTADGVLTVPTGLWVPALTANTTVLTQAEGYTGQYAASCAFVATAVGRKVSGDRSDVAGFYNGVKTAPYIRHTDGTVVYLQVDRPKDTALLTANGWSKNADTGEIIQRAEVAIGDSVGSMLVSVTWPFQFPSKCLRADISLRAANGSPISIIAGFYELTATGATVKFEELNSAVQSGLVLMVEAVGY